MHKTCPLANSVLMILLAIAQQTFAEEPAAGPILWSVDSSADGKNFAVAGPGVWLFDAMTLEKVRSPLLETQKLATRAVWHPRKKVLAVAGGADDVTAIYDFEANRKTELKTKEGARGIAWNSAGSLVATAGNDGSLQIWNAAGTLQHSARREHAKGLTAVAWNPLGNQVVTVGEFITIYDGVGNELKQIRHRTDAKGFCLLLCVAWHPSGEFFAVGDYGNHDSGDVPVLQFWSKEGELLRTIDVPGSAEFRNVSWNREGSLLASASDSLRLWSKDGVLRHTGKSPDLLWGVCWNAVGNELFTSSIQGRVTKWNASAGVVKKVLETATP